MQPNPFTDLFADKPRYLQEAALLYDAAHELARLDYEKEEMVRALGAKLQTVPQTMPAERAAVYAATLAAGLAAVETVYEARRVYLFDVLTRDPVAFEKAYQERFGAHAAG